MDKKKIDRINVLARKQKSEGLNEEEKKEQANLRQEYIEEYKANLKEQLHSIKVVDKEGNDITPKKLKEDKRNKKLN